MKTRVIYKKEKSKPLLTKENISSAFAYHPAINDFLQNARKDYGIYFTPERIVDFMVRLIDTSRFTSKQDINILEPACGLA